MISIVSGLIAHEISIPILKLFNIFFIGSLPSIRTWLDFIKILKNSSFHMIIFSISLIETFQTKIKTNMIKFILPL